MLLLVPWCLWTLVFNRFWQLKKICSTCTLCLFSGCSFYWKWLFHEVGQITYNYLRPREREGFCSGNLSSLSNNVSSFFEINNFFMQHNTKAKEFWIHQLKHTFRSFYDDLFSHLHAKLQLADSIILSEHNLRKYLNKMTALPGFCFSCLCSVTVVRKLNCPLFVLSDFQVLTISTLTPSQTSKKKTNAPNKQSRYLKPLRTTWKVRFHWVTFVRLLRVHFSRITHFPPPPSYPAAHDSSVTHNSSVAVGMAMVVSTQPVESDPGTALHGNKGYAMCLHFISTWFWICPKLKSTPPSSLYTDLEADTNVQEITQLSNSQGFPVFFFF